MDRFLHSSLGHPLLRYWCANSPSLKSSDFMYPLFVVAQEANVPGAVYAPHQPPPSQDRSADGSAEGSKPPGTGGGGGGIPGISKVSLTRLVGVLEGLVLKGLKSVLLFASVPHDLKDDNGSVAHTSANPVLEAITLISLNFPDLLIACDLCLCNFTDHGHCGIIKHAHLEAASLANETTPPAVAHDFPLGTDFIDNAASVARLVEIGLAYSRAGAHVLAPSDMMDGRIGALKAALVEHGLQGRSAIMSYSAKFASAFYGPFRDMVGCKIRGPKAGAGDDCRASLSVGQCHKRRKCLISNDRSQYQLPVGSSALAMRALGRDAREGADILMVKPATAYLDIVRMAKINFPTYPIAVYQVSGEYAMLYYAAASGCVDLHSALVESILCMKRAGADLIITYFAPLLLDIVAEASGRHTSHGLSYHPPTVTSPSELSVDSGIVTSDDSASDFGTDESTNRRRVRGAHLNEMLFL